MLGVKCEHFGPWWKDFSDVSGCGFNVQKINGGGRMWDFRTELGLDRWFSQGVNSAGITYSGFGFATRASSSWEREGNWIWGEECRNDFNKARRRWYVHVESPVTTRSLVVCVFRFLKCWVFLQSATQELRCSGNWVRRVEHVFSWLGRKVMWVLPLKEWIWIRCCR